MERTKVLELMSTLKLYGMCSACDEVMGNGIKRQHEPPRIVGDLQQSEIAEKQARSIRHQFSIAKLPLARDIDDFDFTNTPVNESLVWELPNDTFVAVQRKAALAGSTGTGKSHLAIAIARTLIGNSTRPLLNCCRCGQSARNRNAPPQTRLDGRLPHTPRLHYPR
ncbi:IstB-like ATP binding protein [Rhizobium sp. NFR03]|nr:IstB-like ATP binding protein [Rhizobium sp. NFR03]